MTGFKSQTSGIGSDRSTNWATQPLPSSYLTYLVHDADMLGIGRAISPQV